MPYPSVYNVTYSYTAFQQSQGNNAFPGTQIDADLAGLQATIQSVDTFMQGVIRSDGALNNGIVTFDSLSASLQTAGLAPAETWTAGTPFVFGSSVVQSNKLYRCLVPHTSGVFATDLAAGLWQFVTTIGNMIGPAISVAGNVPKFHDTAGALIDDSGVPLASLAPLASPALTGAPTAPTAAAGNNSTQLATTAYLDSKLAVANGIATLDGTGKLTTAQIPAALVGALQYQGLWNAATNTPMLASGVGARGAYYKVSVAGATVIDTIAQWNVGDILAFDGTTWDKIDGTASEVLSVAGRTGTVVLAVADVTGAAPLASPALSGTPTAPTPANGDNSTKIATTAFVAANSSSAPSGAPWIAYGATSVTGNTTAQNPTPNVNGLTGEVSSLPYTVPAGHTLVLTGWGGSASNAAGGVVVAPYVGASFTNASQLMSAASTGGTNQTGGTWTFPAGTVVNLAVQNGQSTQVINWFMMGVLQ